MRRTEHAEELDVTGRALVRNRRVEFVAEDDLSGASVGLVYQIRR
jgi:hypothetical protein